MINYQLTKVMIRKSGLVLGKNRFGTRWVEIKLNGKTIKRIDIQKGWDRVPTPSEEELYIQSHDFLALEQDKYHAANFYPKEYTI
jgi:hypothetical protein